MDHDVTMDTHRAHMLAAIEAARQGMRSSQGGPFGALITDPKGRVAAVAHNEVLAGGDCTMHAEIAALRKAGRLDLRGYTLYATGFPCVMCLGAILWSRLDTLYYCNDYAMTRDAGFDDEAFLQTFGRIFHCTPSPAGDISLPELTIRRLPLPEGAALYEEWKAMAGRQLY
ncbi:MAG TPA: nucleoside deaminase [Candidatus Avidesulfovibrio excrementigallinarum]|nr:nucleoside deaminase [Candidatus Avidesulfovibrio excrementigallinarum]